MRRGLTIIVSGADLDRLRSALGIAAAEAALGGSVVLFFDVASVPLLHDLPAALQPMLDTAVELGTRVIVCQTGIAEAGLAPLSRYEAGGLVSIMAGLGEDRLLLA